MKQPEIYEELEKARKWLSFGMISEILTPIHDCFIFDFEFSILIFKFERLPPPSLPILQFWK
jgi:hypothetical protein